MSAVGLVIAGAAGRMGRTLVRLASADPALALLAALEVEGHPELGHDAGILAGVAASGVPLTSDVHAALVPGAVLIDFSAPEATLAHLEAAARAGSSAVVGTTGFSTAQQTQVEALTRRVPCVQASNMSVGVTLLSEIVEQAVRRLGATFDIELSEIHHRHKKDAPSGTALTLARAAARGRGVALDEVGLYGREGLVGERSDTEIGVLALRGGDVVGDHTVYLLGPGERIELTHRAHSRDGFAAGALRAAVWLSGRPAGLYSMRDVLAGGV